MLSYAQADINCMLERYRNFVLLTLLTIATTAILWLPFFLRLESVWGIELPKDGMATVVANYDGPFYIVAAKTLYDPAKIEKDFPFQLSPIYYSAHFPLFPLLIRGIVTVLPFLGYLYSMMLVTILTSILAVLMFYILLQNIGIKKHSLWIATLFAIFPARWLIVRSVGSPEPLFLFTIMASIYCFRNQKWWLAGVFGALAQATKSPGILLFFSYLIALIVPAWSSLANTHTGDWLKKLQWKAYPILLIPITLLGIFLFYGMRYGSYFAYFNSGDNIHLTFPPFQVFNPGQTWVGTFWLEEIIWFYCISALGFVYLVKQKRYEFASFLGVFFLSILFITHRDIARYGLPMAPFSMIAFAKLLGSREFKFVTIVLLVPIYLFSIAFIANNITPIADWGPLL